MTTLRPHQIKGAEFLARTIRGGIFDEQRVGKTLAILDAMRRLGPSAVPALIVCPSTGGAMWSDLAESHVQTKVARIKTKSFRPPTDHYNVIVVPWSLVGVKKIKDYLYSRPFKLVVLDESQFAKNQEARRTKVVFGRWCDGRFGLVERAARVWCATGTPIPNNPSELWPMLRAIAPERILMSDGRPMDYWAFVNRFCEYEPDNFGWKITGGKNLDELRQRLKGFYIRRKQSDIGIQPPIVSVHPLDPEKPLDQWGLPKGHPELADLRRAIQQAAGDIDWLGDEHLAQVLRWTGIAKAGPTASMLIEELDANPDSKVVVFYWHREVGDILEVRLKAYGVLRLDGRTPAQQRDGIDREFRTRPECRVFLGQIITAGTLIDLSVADNVVFVEYSWTPSDNAQPMMRCSNMNKTSQVYVRFVKLLGSADEAKTEVVANKSRTIAKILD